VSKSALVLFAHGSRDPEWARPFTTVQQRVAAKNRDIQVELAFLELMKPTLSEAVDALAASGCRRVKIAPLFMAQGAHLKQDLAKLIADVRARHDEIELSLLPALGEVDSVIDAMSTWLAEHAQ
jgi:sirohydrochlorin cobaltochelatase